MPTAKCVRRCFDNNISRRYWPGDQDEIAPDHVFIKAGCFEFLEPLPKKEQVNLTDVESKRGPGRPPKNE